MDEAVNVHMTHQNKLIHDVYTQIKSKFNRD